MTTTFAPPTLQQIRRAAVLCYFDELTDEQIARELGICRRTLARWKLRPEFRVAYGAAADVGTRLIEAQYQEKTTALTHEAPYRSPRGTHAHRSTRRR